MLNNVFSEFLQRIYNLKLNIMHDMRAGIILIISFLTTSNAFCQDITGQWFGRLETPNSIVNLVFNISKTEEGYKSTMDSPGQKATGIPIAYTSYFSSVLKMQIANSVDYEGILNNENIFIGNFKQAGKSLLQPADRNTLELFT